MSDTTGNHSQNLPKVGDKLWTCIGGSWEKRSTGIKDRPVAPYLTEITKHDHLYTATSTVKGRVENCVMLRETQLFQTEEEAWKHYVVLVSKKIASLEQQIKDEVKKLTAANYALALFRSVPGYKPDIGTVELCNSD